MRDQVKLFADEMERVLKENDYKGGWDNCHVLHLFMMLENEVKELKDSLFISESNKEDKIFLFDASQECIDVANFAMMIHDILTKKQEKV